MEIVEIQMSNEERLINHSQKTELLLTISSIFFPLFSPPCLPQPGSRSIILSDTLIFSDTY